MDFRRFDNQWFALQVKTRFEPTCARILRSKGYEEYLPLCKCTSRRIGAQNLSALQPLFPGYVFCRLNANAKGLVVTTPGVIRVVGYGGIPIAISDEEIASVRSCTESGRPLYPWPHLYVGQRIRVTAGPLRGVEGNLIRVKKIHRLVVSINLLQQAAAVEIDADWAVSASPSITTISPAVTVGQRTIA
jgi:transcription antitermination factor NusG